MLYFNGIYIFPSLLYSLGFPTIQNWMTHEELHVYVYILGKHSYIASGVKMNVYLYDFLFKFSKHSNVQSKNSC